jgi:hypothetical protein
MILRFALPGQKCSILFFLIIFGTAANSQITKGNWLLGGNINFSSIDYSSDLGTQTTIDFRLSGRAGYFVMDKFVCGLTPNLLFNKVEQFTRVKTTDIFLGVFARYYILPSEQRVNVFTEADFSLGLLRGSGPNKENAQRYSIAVGPVIFLNSSVALELSIGYSYTNFTTPGNLKTKMFQSGIGLQFYLERDTD